MGVNGDLKWTPDLGPLVKVYGVLFCRNRWSKTDDNIPQEV
jgi:hypothetical protein